ncbi:TetR/AcrR family transcriptional regulator [Reinekea sp.]|jgi:AcrR family transcriptional regulator|uniref:TetR/AcrR family transcriptional regulator n=1 Tax=Reinekea sp. TaxID=1970455 RepID=UPI00398A0417
MKTKDKIIQASLKLFNQQGERVVTTNHIAEHLNISPGLLYYHFKNKESIIQAIFLEYTLHIKNAITVPNDTSDPSEFLATYCDDIFEGIWHYRFLHLSMPTLLIQHNELHNHYLEAHQLLIARASSAVQWLRDFELIEIEENQIATLVDLMRLVTGFWVGFSIANHLGTELTKKQVHAGREHLIALLAPYATPSGKVIFNNLSTTVP